MARDYPLEKVRNIGIIAHIDAGKTTVSERVLYYTGVSHKIGEVHEGEAIMDWMEQEQERGITITSAATTAFWTPTYLPADLPAEASAKAGALANVYRHRLNIIDTPGHIDFTVEVKRSLRVLDGAVVIFDGVAGVEPQSETNWRYADEGKVPRMCFVNKLDRMGASFEHSFKTILDRLSKKAVRAQLPIGVESEHEGVIDLLKMKGYLFEGEKGKEIKEIEIPEKYLEDAKIARAELVERIAEYDEQLTTDFLEGKELALDDLKRAMRKAVINNDIFPVFCGSALKNKGVQLMLNAVVDYLPSPLDMPPIAGVNPTTGGEELRKTSDDEAFSALAFKLQADPFVGQLTFFRVYSGILKSGSYVYNSINEEKERVGRIVRLHANHREEVAEVYAGEIAAIVGLKNTKTGHTLCDENRPIILEGIKVPEPVVEMRIEPKTKADQEKMGLAMKKLSDEDPTFKIKTDSETMETIIAGMGELHLEVLVERMKREFNVEANTGKPQVAYKETITGEAEAEGKYIKQSGGRGQYGHVRIRVKPLPKEVETNKKIAKNIKREANFEFINNIKGGAIPGEYIPAVEKGIREGLSRGITAGFEVVDVSVELYDGSYHDVDSSEMAFKMAGSMAIQDATKRAKPVLLEPIMGVEVVVPDKFMGDVTGHLSSKRGQIESMEERVELKVIKAKVPLAEMFGYVTTLRSMTEGRGNYTMEFSNYAIIPTSVAQAIIESRK